MKNNAGGIEKKDMIKYKTKSEIAEVNKLYQ